MAKNPKSDGAEIRAVTSGPDIDHDKLISNIAARNNEDAVRSSSAGESRQKIGEFLDETNMNSQAYSWCRTILKKKDEAKALDVIRSLEAALPMIKAHVTGQNTPDFLDDVPKMPKARKPSYDPEPDVDEGAPRPVMDVPDDFRDEVDDFDKQLAEVYPT